MAEEIRDCGGHPVEALSMGERNDALCRAVLRGLHASNWRGLRSVA
jgi:hypothetical protein